MRSVSPAPSEYDRSNEQDFRTTIERAIADLSDPIAAYSIAATSSGDPERELVSAPTLTELADVVKTLLNDLKATGRIS